MFWKHPAAGCPRRRYYERGQPTPGDSHAGDPAHPGRENSRAGPAGADFPADGLGGPDSFGYTYDNSGTVSWQDTSSGADTGLTGDGQNNAIQVPLPFPFKYYENSYTSLYISAAGYLSFADNGNWPNSGSLPSPNLPNYVIAPYWGPTFIGRRRDLPVPRVLSPGS